VSPLALTLTAHILQYNRPEVYQDDTISISRTKHSAGAEYDLIVLSKDNTKALATAVFVVVLLAAGVSLEYK
jgi:hypothetical protein